MKIIDGIQQKGKRISIPDCGRDELPEFFVQMGYKVGAEIGVHTGGFTEVLCRSGLLKVYGIDPWLYYDDFPHPRGQRRLDQIYSQALNTLAPYKNCTLIRKTSMDALSDFKNESLDFVYIDGNHQLRYIIEDLCEWSKKVRKGGVVSGHDYFYADNEKVRAITHVAQAVDTYTGCYHINNWYILGRKDIIPGETRDRWRSWMWIKE